MVKTRRSAEGGKRGRGQATEAQPDPAPAAPSFEDALEQLEGTVSRLEEGEMPLEEALDLFEAGVKLSRQCSTTLEKAERRIEILVADRNGDGRAVPFDSVEDEDEDADSADFEEDVED